MRFKVTPRRRHGKAVSSQELQQGTPVIGDLQVIQVMAEEMGRYSTSAQFQNTGGSDHQPLPPLLDVTLSWMGPNGMVLSGYEVVDGVTYAQSWWCRPID